MKMVYQAVLNDVPSTRFQFTNNTTESTGMQEGKFLLAPLVLGRQNILKVSEYPYETWEMKNRTPTEQYEVFYWDVCLKCVGLSVMLKVTSTMFQSQILRLK